MKYLAIDVSGEYMTVIAKNGEKKSVSFTPDSGVRHSVNLMVEVEKAVEEAELDLKEADFFAAAVGPGSFTGIRIGVSTAKGFADAYKKKVLPITTLEAIAYTENEGKRLAVIDAKHGCFYVAGYDGLQLSFEPKFINREELDQLSKEYELLVYRPIEGLFAKTVDISLGLEKAILLKKDEASMDTDFLAPFYLRLSQAEEGRK